MRVYLQRQGMDRLPLDIKVKIAQMFQKEDLPNLRLVNKDWCAAATTKYKPKGILDCQLMRNKLPDAYPNLQLLDLSSCLVIDNSWGFYVGCALKCASLLPQLATLNMSSVVCPEGTCSIGTLSNLR